MRECGLLNLSKMPVFQNKMYPDRLSALNCAVGEITLVQDHLTGLIHNAAFDPTLLVYDEYYQNEQANSCFFQAHINDVINKIEKYFTDSKVIEIGCGKGHFLELLKAKGFDVLGIDPAYEGSADYIVKSEFSSNMGVSGGCFVLRHVLEHISSPFDFLYSIKQASGGIGRIYIEVPCFDWILEHRAWFDIFYEHVNYFRLSDLTQYFGHVIDSGKMFGGQYIYIIGDLATLNLNNQQMKINRVTIPNVFFSGLDILKTQTNLTGKRVIWGAGAKGATFGHYARLSGYLLDFVVDINPAKQDKFMAGSGLEVLSPDAALEILNDGDQVFVMNSNYLDEITLLGGEKLTYICIDK
ncbi:MAG: methyltransferase [Gammaproteobacteria bacterium CG22_combo_CG10-13_8_21_14_all_40_8]|nr:MAG: methyltransferase [Gammaproteobacteria bacterium CG22_combo_CG10-13_8_21_14_all_40_8]